MQKEESCFPIKEKKKDELSYPKVLKFEWEGHEGDLFEFSEYVDFSNSYSVRCNEPFCEIDNLKIGTKYYWRINGGKTQHFFTKDNKIRFIRIDGALNVRDLGGNKIEQGLIYRGSDIDLIYPISERGKETFLDILGIKTEIDLRMEVNGNRPCIFGNRVVLKSFPYRPYNEIFEAEHRQGICKIMDFLSDENNYPIYIHCIAGADRTGMISLFLRALAGESDDDIHMDYELTSLSTSTYAYGAQEMDFRTRNGSYYTEFLEMLDIYAPGKSLSEKVRAFLIDCGVTNECLDTILCIIKKKKYKG